MLEDICPYCDYDMSIKGELYESFISHDYSTCFDHECSNCGKVSEIEVEAIPAFTPNKKNKV